MQNAPAGQGAGYGREVDIWSAGVILFILCVAVPHCEVITCCVNALGGLPLILAG